MDSYLQWFNAFEAVLWITISIVFGFHFVRKKTAFKMLKGFSCVAFFVFGITDIIEIYSGAWWAPFWLQAGMRE